MHKKLNQVFVSAMEKRSGIEQLEQMEGDQKENVEAALNETFKRNDYFLIIGVFCLALAVRIIYNFTNARHYTPIFDAALYHTIARHLVDAHCYCLYTAHPTVSRAPLWPWIMMIIYAIFGKDNLYARLFYSFLGSGTCVFVFLLAKDIFGRRFAIITGIVAAIYTGLFIYDGWLYAESLYTFCLIGFIYTLYRLQRILSLDRSKRDFAGAGSRGWGQRWLPVHRGLLWPGLSSVFLAAAVLARPNGSSLYALLGLWAFLLALAKIIPWRVALSCVAVISLLATLLIAPWTYRNYMVTHQFVFVATGMGEVIIGSYNDGILRGDLNGRGFWRPPVGTLIHDQPGYTPDKDKADTAKGLSWIGTHLQEMPDLLSLHFLNMWKPYTVSLGLPMEEFPDRLSSKILASLIPNMFIPIFRLAALGLVVTWKKKKQELVIVYLVLLQTVALNVAFYGTMRFRAPIEPLLVLLAGGAVWWLVSNEDGTLRSFIKTMSVMKKNA